MNSIFAVFILGICSVSIAKTFEIKDGIGKLVGRGSIEASKISIDLKGAQAGIRAIHIHEKGKCEGPDFKTSGGHLNPDKKMHGHQNPKGAHLGDLGNIEIPANGNLKKEFKLSSMNQIKTPEGTSLIIHAKADDEKTDPSGAAGDRIYCGILSEPTHY